VKAFNSLNQKNLSPSSSARTSVDEFIDEPMTNLVNALIEFCRRGNLQPAMVLIVSFGNPLKSYQQDALTSKDAQRFVDSTRYLPVLLSSLLGKLETIISSSASSSSQYRQAVDYMLTIGLLLEQYYQIYPKEQSWYLKMKTLLFFFFFLQFVLFFSS
jgi:hypothetical protein